MNITTVQRFMNSFARLRRTTGRRKSGLKQMGTVMPYKRPFFNVKVRIIDAQLREENGKAYVTVAPANAE